MSQTKDDPIGSVIFSFVQEAMSVPSPLTDDDETVIDLATICAMFFSLLRDVIEFDWQQPDVNIIDYFNELITQFSQAVVDDFDLHAGIEQYHKSLVGNMVDKMAEHGHQEMEEFLRDHT